MLLLCPLTAHCKAYTERPREIRLGEVDIWTRGDAAEEGTVERVEGLGGDEFCFSCIV